MRKKETLPRNFRDIPIVSKGGFGPEVERMIRDEIIAREDELRQKYQDYIDDTGDRATPFAEFARMIIATEEGLIEKGDNTMKHKIQEVDVKKIIKDLGKDFGGSNEDQGKVMTIKEEIQINDIILEVGDRIKVLNEKTDVEKLIKDFIETDWSKSQEAAGKAVNLLKGLAFSDDDMAEKFIKDLDKLSNSMSVKDYVSE